MGYVGPNLDIRGSGEDVQYDEDGEMIDDNAYLFQGLFAAANIFSSLKLVYIFSVNPYLGPLQVLFRYY